MQIMHVKWKPTLQNQLAEAFPFGKNKRKKLRKKRREQTCGPELKLPLNARL